MRKYLIIIVLLSFILASISGCGYSIGGYKPSVTHIETLKQKVGDNNFKLNVRLSKLNTMATKSIICRLDGTIKLPNNGTYEDYILDALKKDLAFAGIYEAETKNYLEINFKNISFNSTIGAKWVIEADVYNSADEKVFNVLTKYDFDSSYDATAACAKVSEAFPDAVEKFIDDLTSNPNFLNFINAK